MTGLDADALRPNSNAKQIDGAAISQRRLMGAPHRQAQVSGSTVRGYYLQRATQDIPDSKDLTRQQCNLLSVVQQRKRIFLFRFP